MAFRQKSERRQEPDKDHLEAKEWFQEVEGNKRKNVITYLVAFLATGFMGIIFLQALGYSHLPIKSFYAIVAGLVAAVGYVMRQVIKNR